jgi:hypothetical protein
MTQLVSILGLAVLIFIAAELYVIARELGRLLTLQLKERESAEVQAAGQTINVNLAPVPGQQAAGGSIGTVTLPGGMARAAGSQPQAALNPGAFASADASGGPDEQSAATAAEPRIIPRVMPSGVLAVKCPRCQAENSSYRGECFNCGAQL